MNKQLLELNKLLDTLKKESANNYSTAKWVNIFECAEMPLNISWFDIGNLFG